MSESVLPQVVATILCIALTASGTYLLFGVASDQTAIRQFGYEIEEWSLQEKNVNDMMAIASEGWLKSSNGNLDKLADIIGTIAEDGDKDAVVSI